MRQAISTEYRAPTNSRGSRIIARAEAGRVVVPWDHALGQAENHRAAAMAYAQRMGWDGRWVGGGTQAGFVWVDVTGAQEAQP